MVRGRGVGLIFLFMGFAVAISIAGVLFAYATFSRTPNVPVKSTLVQRVGGGLAEAEPSGVVSQLFLETETLRALVDNLRKAKVDDRIEGVIIMPTGFGGLWGKVQEVRDAILDFKASGKPIVAYLEYGADQEYYLATAADEIYLMPTSTLDLDGLASFELFFRGTLDKIGAFADLVHIGEYKTASNTFTEDGFTPAHREMSDSLNGDLYRQLVRAIADARDKTEAEVRDLLDEGPFLAEEALRFGLVDGLAYEDEIEERASLGSGDLERLDGRDYQGVSPVSLGLDGGPDKVALIYAVGAIGSGESQPDGPGGSAVGSATLSKYIREAREDESVKAIVLRVDSPGGSVVGSDAIWRELTLAGERKPLIASMSDVAASGGYYIAMAAETIVAQPGTLTGSIGVVVGKFVTAGTMEKLGVSVESVSRGRFAELNSPFRPYSPSEREKITKQIEAIYTQFVAKVAEARGTTPERIDTLAQGRVWTGAQAREIGLVDELGGLDRALVLAKERAGLPADGEVELVVYPPRKSFLELLRNPLRAESRLALLGALLEPAEFRALAGLTMPLRLFRRGEPLALMPNVFVH